MDLRLGASDFHVPPEILDFIVGFLADDKAGILKTRLICNTLGQIATKRLMSKVSKPSEILTKGTLHIADNEMSDRYPKASPNAVTVWTWIRLPRDAFQSFDFTNDFKNMLCAPEGYKDRTFGTAKGGRVSTCWARMMEDEDLVAIGMQFYNEETLHRYRSSKEAAALSDYIEELWPNSLSTSTSTRWLLRSPGRGQDSLGGWGYTEIRTVYFKADMTAEQRTALAKIRTNQAMANRRPLPDTQPGPTTWAWLPGFHVRKGKLAVAAMFLLRWRNKALEETFREDYGLWIGEEYVPQPQNFERELDAAGRVDEEVYHCNLESGPWRA